MASIELDHYFDSFTLEFDYKNHLPKASSLERLIKVLDTLFKCHRKLMPF